MKKLLLLLFLIALPLHAQESTEEPFPPEGWMTVDHGRLSLIARVGLAGLLRDMLAPVYDLMATNTGRQPQIQLLVVEDGLLPGCTRAGAAPGSFRRRGPSRAGGRSTSA